MHWKDEKCIQSSGWMNCRLRGHLEDKDRYNDNIKMDIKDIQWLLTGFIWLRTD